jgi:exodeoxyribonuclease VII small subunit
MQKEKQKYTFEQAMQRLEEIVNKLELGNVPLEETISLFQEGMELINFCNQKLEEVKHKVEIVIRNKNGFTIQPFDVKTEYQAQQEEEEIEEFEEDEEDNELF